MSNGIRKINNVFEQKNQREVKCKDNIFGNFLVNQGLYDEIEITKENIYELADLVGGKVKLDVYVVIRIFWQKIYIHLIVNFMLVQADFLTVNPVLINYMIVTACFIFFKGVQIQNVKPWNDYVWHLVFIIMTKFWMLQ